MSADPGAAALCRRVRGSSPAGVFVKAYSAAATALAVLVSGECYFTARWDCTGMCAGMCTGICTGMCPVASGWLSKRLAGQG